MQTSAGLRLCQPYKQKLSHKYIILAATVRPEQRNILDSVPRYKKELPLPFREQSVNSYSTIYENLIFCRRRNILKDLPEVI